MDSDTFSEAIDSIMKSKPQVLLVDCENASACFSYVKRVREVSPSTRCLLFDQGAGDDFEAQAAQGGAWGLVSERADPESLKKAIQAVLRGEMWFSPTTMARTVHSLVHHKLPESPTADKLTAREAEITALLAKGFQNKEIAQRLLISENTVRRYTETIYRKLRVNSRVEVAVWYYQRSQH
ncbi:MAG TPA: response regulator transcription factor [Terriglobia bacterium]|nr:response regulator transcription factor [Terriglobia bacterium]